MDRRQRESLDRYITGNWGEDQFREEEPEHDCELVFIGVQDGVREGQCRICGDLSPMTDEVTRGEVIEVFFFAPPDRKGMRHLRRCLRRHGIEDGLQTALREWAALDE